MPKLTAERIIDAGPGGYQAGSISASSVAGRIGTIGSHVLATTEALGAEHRVSGLTAGQVLRASGETTALFAQLAHADLSGIGANDHHAQAHAYDSTDHTGSLSWSNLSKTGSNLNEIATRSHTVLSDIGSYTHAQIDSHINTSDTHVAHSGVTMTAGDGLTGGGTIASSRTFAVGVSGLGLGVGADAVTLTSSSAGEANAHILATDTSGHTRVQRLGIGTSPSASLTIKPATNVAMIRLIQNNADYGYSFIADSTNGNLSLLRYGSGSDGATFVSIKNDGKFGINRTDPSYTFDVSGTGRFTSSLYADDDLVVADTMDVTGVATLRANVTSASYASQTTGWRITSAGEADFRYLFVDEMHAKSSIADLEQALAGGQIIAKSVAQLYSNFTAPAAGATAQLVVRDLPSATGMAVFVNGDHIRIRTFSRSGGSLTIGDCWGTVTLDTSYGTSGFDSTTKSQRYTFTRSSGADAGAMAAGTVVYADAIILDYGTAGNGIYEVNAIDGLYGLNSPYAQVATWATHPRSMSVKGRFGNLRGIFSVDNEYGLYAGSGTAVTDRYIRASNAALELRNVPLALYDGNANTMLLSAGESNNSPFLALGSALPTGPLTNNGIWVGKDGADYEFRVGSVSGGALTNGIHWDGSALLIGNSAAENIYTDGSTLEFRNATEAQGSLSATTWTLGKLATNYVKITPSSIEIGRNSVAAISLDGSGNASFTGAITANSGSIAGALTMGASGSITATNTVLDASGITISTSTSWTLNESYKFSTGSVVHSGLWCQNSAADVRLQLTANATPTYPVGYYNDRDSTLYLSAYGKGAGKLATTQLQAHHETYGSIYFGVSSTSTGRKLVGTNVESFTINNYVVWHAGNDGHTSYLDADTLDTYEASAFGRLASANIWSATQTLKPATNVAMLRLIQNNADYGYSFIADSTNGNLSLLRYGSGSDGATFVSVKNDGKVGIGNIDPGYNFDVTGTGRFTGIVNADAGLRIGGDPGGAASTIALSNVTAAAAGAQAYSFKMNGGVAYENSGWMKIYVGTAARYIPYWTSI